MKRTIHCKYILLIFILLLVSTFAKTQDTILNRKISVSINNSLYEALNIIGDSLGYYFSYNSDLIDEELHVKKTFTQCPVIYILDSLFNDHKMIFQVIGNQIVINEKESDYFISSTQGRKRISLKGNILDKSSGKGIPYATIGIKTKKNWTISNYSGEYVLKIDDTNLNDSINVSCLGYQGVDMSIKELLKDTVNKIYMPVEYISIQEVIIRKINPQLLLKRSINEIENNFQVIPSEFQGFYREIIYKSQRPMTVVEGVVDGYKSSYSNKMRKDQIRFLKGRKIFDNQKGDTVLLKLQAGLYNSMLLDVIKNPPDFLEINYLDDYKYKVSDIIISQNKDVYVIEFNRTLDAYDAYYKGRIYIDYESATILNVEFSLNQKGIENASHYMIRKKPSDIRIKSTGANYNVNYILGKNNRYQINYIRSESCFKIRNKKQLFNSDYKIVSELAFMSFDYNHPDQKMKDEISGRNDIFTEQVKNYDETFWKDYNYIPPEKTLLEAVNDNDLIRINIIKE